MREFHALGVKISRYLTFGQNAIFENIGHFQQIPVGTGTAIWILNLG